MEAAHNYDPEKKKKKEKQLKKNTHTHKKRLLPAYLTIYWRQLRFRLRSPITTSKEKWSFEKDVPKPEIMGGNEHAQTSWNIWSWRKEHFDLSFLFLSISLGVVIFLLEHSVLCAWKLQNSWSRDLVHCPAVLVEEQFWYTQNILTHPKRDHEKNERCFKEIVTSLRAFDSAEFQNATQAKNYLHTEKSSQESEFYTTTCSAEIQLQCYHSSSSLQPNYTAFATVEQCSVLIL